MKFFGLIFLILTFAFCAFGQTFYGSTDVKVFREGREKEMRNKEESPLLETDFSLFKGIENFNYSAKFRVKARYIKAIKGNPVTILTSSGKSRKALIVGTVKFKLADKPFELNVYEFEGVPQDEYKDLLFIPFKDLTNGNETYSGGRYIDIWRPKSSKLIIDFNLAYNPNCAYGSDRYNCPIPPKNNFLKTRVLAGEKKFVSPNGKSTH